MADVDPRWRVGVARKVDVFPAQRNRLVTLQASVEQDEHQRLPGWI